MQSLLINSLIQIMLMLPYYVAKETCPDNSISPGSCFDESDCSEYYICMDGICCPTCQWKLNQRQNVTLVGNRASNFPFVQCDSSGNYAAEQCESPNSGLCWCVTELGLEIDGTRLQPEQLRQLSCMSERTRDLRAPASISAASDRCSSDGAFDALNDPSACVFECATDSDCQARSSDSSKCCWSGCSRRCVVQQLTKLATTPPKILPISKLAVKLEKCTLLEDSINVKIIASLVSCSVDNECSSDQKCCETKAGNKCVNRDFDHPSESVTSNYKHLTFSSKKCHQTISKLSLNDAKISSPLLKTCEADSDCPDNLVCCHALDGKACYYTSESARTAAPNIEALGAGYGSSGTLKISGPGNQVRPAEVTAAIFEQVCRDPNEEVRNCGDPCPSTCEDVNQTRPLWCASGVSCVKGCFCRSGYIRQNREFSSPCIPKNQCHVVSDSKSPISDQSNVALAVQTSAKIEGCPDERLHPIVAQSISSGRTSLCFGDSDCPDSQKCCPVPQPFTFLSGRRCLCSDSNAQWVECAPPCPNYCGYSPAEEMANCQNIRCKPGCVCVSGYVKQSSGVDAECIPHHWCPQANTTSAYNQDSKNFAMKSASAKLIGTKNYSTIGGVVNFRQISSKEISIDGLLGNLTPNSIYSLAIQPKNSILGGDCQFDESSFGPTPKNIIQHENPFISVQEDVCNQTLLFFKADAAGNTNSSAINGKISLIGNENMVGRSVIIKNCGIADHNFNDWNRTQFVTTGNYDCNFEIVACGIIGLSE